MRIPTWAIQKSWKTNYNIIFILIRTLWMLKTLRKIFTSSSTSSIFSGYIESMTFLKKKMNVNKNIVTWSILMRCGMMSPKSKKNKQGWLNITCKNKDNRESNNVQRYSSLCTWPSYMKESLIYKKAHDLFGESRCNGKWLQTWWRPTS